MKIKSLKSKRAFRKASPLMLAGALMSASLFRAPAYAYTYLVEPTMEVSYIHYIGENMVEASTSGGKILMDENGQVLVSNKYSSVETFEDGFAIVSANGEYSVIETTFREVVPPVYTDYVTFYEDKGLVNVNLIEKSTDEQTTWKYGLFDMATGNEIVPVECRDILEVGNNFLVVKDGKLGIIANPAD